MRLASLALAATTLSICGVLPAHAVAPVHFWSQTFGSTGNDAALSVTVGVSGDVFMTGYFSGAVDFGGGALVSAGGEDIFFAKYDANGTHQWSQRFGNTLGDNGRSVFVDASGNVLLTGKFSGIVDFGGGPLSAMGSSDVFLAKFDANGVYQWSQRFGGSDIDAGTSVVVDDSGSVYLMGTFRGTGDFGGGPLVSAGGSDIFLAKYDGSGIHQWSQRFGSTSNFDTGKSISVDGSGNVVLAGNFSETADFGGGPLVSSGGTDIFLAKYDTNGVHQWSQRFGGPNGDSGEGVAVDIAGNIFATGAFRDTVDFGGGPLVNEGNGDAFLVKFNAAGFHEWSEHFGGVDGAIGNELAVDGGSGNILLVGDFNGTGYFGGPPLTSHGDRDIVLATYDASGAHLMSQGYGSPGFDRGLSIGTDGTGTLVVTGFYEGSVDLGGGPLVSNGGNDTFLAKFSDEPEPPVIASITDVGNDQGRQVRILFHRSWHDRSASPTPVQSYEVYRRDDPPPGSGFVVPNRSTPSSSGLLAEGWIFVGSAPAHEEESYGLIAPTIGDSTEALGQYHSVFYIRGATLAPGTFFDSPPDSGYSIDNLAPGVPTNLAYDAGQLSWDESSETDFDYFTVYGGDSDDFSLAFVLETTVVPTSDVTDFPFAHYFVAATDFSGNEGDPAAVESTTHVEGVPRSYALAVANNPNPFHGSTIVNYTVPSRGVVTVAIYDAGGARVATLVNGEHEAGAYSAEWLGRTDSNAGLPFGIYFARIERDGVTRSRKMVKLR